MCQALSYVLALAVSVVTAHDGELVGLRLTENVITKEPEVQPVTIDPSHAWKENRFGQRYPSGTLSELCAIDVAGRRHFSLQSPPGNATAIAVLDIDNGNTTLLDVPNLNLLDAVQMQWVAGSSKMAVLTKYDQGCTRAALFLVDVDAGLQRANGVAPNATQAFVFPAGFACIDDYVSMVVNDGKSEVWVLLLPHGNATAREDSDGYTWTLFGVDVEKGALVQPASSLVRVTPGSCHATACLQAPMHLSWWPGTDVAIGIDIDERPGVPGFQVAALSPTNSSIRLFNAIPSGLNMEMGISFLAPAPDKSDDTYYTLLMLGGVGQMYGVNVLNESLVSTATPFPPPKHAPEAPVYLPGTKI